MPLALAPPAFAVALAHRWLAENPRQALAHFTWVNNVTLAADRCRFAYDEQGSCLTRRLDLPFTAVAVLAETAAAVRRLAAELVPPHWPVYTLAPTSTAALLREAVGVDEIRPEWQMVFRGDAGTLDPGPARPLGRADLPAMMALARLGGAMVFGAEAMAHGAFFGVFVGAELVAMGGVQNELPGWAEIGSIVTHPAHRRQGHATHVVAALVRYLQARGQQTFLCLFQDNEAAFRLYDKLGFAVLNELVLVRWRRTR
ncbi:MAG: GNAT family N-acetyltransferase [Caldilineales bacterium]|nr:GNAT family N-acetyltransferase [Caldilineales bacterium]